MSILPFFFHSIFGVDIDQSLRLAIGILIFFIGMIGMFVFSRYRYRNQIPLKENHFWLYHRYYRRVAEAGVYGLISLLLSICALGNNETDPPTIAVICITSIVTALFGLLASRSYIKTRQARKVHETPQPQLRNLSLRPEA